MNNLLDTVAESYPINLDRMIEELPSQSSSIPEASIRNRAALTAMLSEDSSKALQNYQNIISEAQTGTSYTRDQIVNSAKSKQVVSDRQSLMSILADPNLSLDVKKQAIANINSEFNLDTSTMLASEAAKRSVEGESREAEDVRIIGAEQFKSIREAKENRQQIINQAYAKADPSFSKLSLDVAEQAIAPFATNKMAYGVLNDILNLLGKDEKRSTTSALPGTSIQQIREKLAALPASDLVIVQNKIKDIVMSDPRIIYTNDNQFAKAQLLETLLSGREYSTFDKVLDNTVGILDVFGVGSLLKSGIRKFTSVFTKTPENIQRNIELRQVTSTSSPVSPLKTVEDVNPDAYRDMYALVVKSDSDEVAKAVSGTTKDEMLIEAHMPQPASIDGSVAFKVAIPDKKIVPEASVIKELEDTGALFFSETERIQAGTKTVNDFTNITGVVPLDNMLTVGIEGQNRIIKAILGTSEGGFLKAEEALNQVKFSLREYGVVDNDLTLMKKIEDEYVPISLEEAKLSDGNYVVSLNLKQRLNASDITKFDEETVKLNWFDRIPILRSTRSGTVANNLVDHASMLSPRYTGPAVISSDKAVRIDRLLIQMHTKFSDAYLKLPKDRQNKVYEHLKEANHLGLELDDGQLLGRGFVKDEIDVIKSWRKNWDTHFWLENQDVVKTLSHQGFKVLDNQSNGTKLFAKEVTKNQNIAKVYDPATDSIITTDKQFMDSLYQSGGSYAVLRRPINIDGTVVEHMIVRNTPTEYLRGLRDFDQVLNYRKGYFQVQYRAPKFIEEIVRDTSGNELFRRALNVAGDTKEAEQIVNRLVTTTGRSKDDFNIRSDLKELRVDTDAYWDLHTASGRIAQRHRGKRLEDSVGPVGGFDSRYMLDPVESVIRASRSLSGRIASRDSLEVAKARAMQQYAEFFPSDGKGGKVWVENSNSLVSRSDKYSSKIADARTTVEYINYLQHGYVNALDESFKSAMNASANMLSNISSKGERSFLWLGTNNPTDFLKHGVFQSYIALNPFRQMLIQGHQSVRLLGYNLPYIYSGQFALDGEKTLRYLSGLSDINTASKADRELVEFVQKSGMLDAVDKQNLVRGSLTQLAESHSRTKRIIGSALSIPRKLGFDIGEQANLTSHLLAVRDKFIRSGKNINDPTVREEAYSVARALTYDMNFAGDMPYNQNAFGLFLQFLQVPHKAFLSLTNRRIPVGDRLRLAMTDTILFGVPGALAIENLIGKEMLPSDPVAREQILFGLASVAYNGAFSKLAGKDVKVDFSSLSPFGIDGFAHLAHAVVSGGMLEFIQNSPAFSLYLKDGSKVQEAFGNMFRAFGFIETQQGIDKEDATSVLKGFLEISSGWSNATKAAMIYNTGKIIDKKTGQPILEDADFMYAAAQMFGFKSQKEVFEWAALREMSQNDKDREKQWKEAYDSYIRLLTRDSKISITDPEAQIKILGAMKLMFKDDYKAQEWFSRKLSQDMVSRQDVIIKRIVEAGNFKDASSTMSATKNLNSLNDSEYTKALKLFEDLQKTIKEQE